VDVLLIYMLLNAGCTFLSGKMFGWVVINPGEYITLFYKVVKQATTAMFCRTGSEDVLSRSSMACEWCVFTQFLLKCKQNDYHYLYRKSSQHWSSQYLPSCLSRRVTRCDDAFHKTGVTANCEFLLTVYCHGTVNIVNYIYCAVTDMTENTRVTSTFWSRTGGPDKKTHDIWFFI